MAGTPRCELCGRFGKSELGGLCTPCDDKRLSGDDTVNLFGSFDTSFDDPPFIPDEFGMDTDKFGIER